MIKISLFFAIILATAASSSSSYFFINAGTSTPSISVGSPTYTQTTIGDDTYNDVYSCRGLQENNVLCSTKVGPSKLLKGTVAPLSLTLSSETTLANDCVENIFAYQPLGPESGHMAGCYDSVAHTLYFFSLSTLQALTPSSKSVASTTGDTVKEYYSVGGDYWFMNDKTNIYRCSLADLDEACTSNTGLTDPFSLVARPHDGGKVWISFQSEASGLEWRPLCLSSNHRS